MKIDFSRIKSMALKEYKHIIRDKFTMMVGFAFPIFVVIIFGFIINLNYEHVKLYVKDDSKTKQSRELAEMFAASGYFDISYADDANPVRYIENNDTAGVMVIDKDFGKNAANNKSASVQLLIDGSDNSKAGLISGYAGSIQSIASDRMYSSPALKFDIRPRFLFNPELNSKWFIVPGLIVVIIGLLAILLTSLTIAKEWEKGSMELLLSTHIKPIEIVLGKIIPYFLLSFMATATVFYVARVVFGVPFTGSFLVFCIACSIYITACLAWGILISVITRQQMLAMMIAMVMGLLPSVLLSGFIFPIENMPDFFKWLTFVLPQRWFMEICRSVFLRDAAFLDMAFPLAMISIFCVLMILAAVKKFKTDVEP